MASEQLDLLQWQPPAQVVPFPSANRIGHARKVANQLSKARTCREADHAILRALQAFRNQMERASIHASVIEAEEQAFKTAIKVECERINSGWVPLIKNGACDPKGAR